MRSLQILSTAVFVAFMLAGCSENSTTISRAQGQIQGVERQMIEVVTIAEKNLQAHVSDDTSRPSNPI